jgi:DNA-binding response OmpR family regulator
MSLLIVDDDPDQAEATRRTVAGTEYGAGEVLAVDTLAAAVKAVATTPVDVVLLALDPADGVAIQVLEAVRAVTDAVVVVLARCCDELRCVEPLRHGADEVVEAGALTPARLSRAVGGALTRRSIRRVRSRIDSGLQKLSEAMGVV